MTAAFTILLPHKRNPGNDRALSICLDMLMANTVHDFILLMDAAADEPLYPRVNAMVQQATTDCCVYWASDMFPSKGWDVPMLDCFAADTFVNNTVVEPGVISMYGGNHKKDFGRRPETFERAAFENWCATEGHVAGGEGWYAPVMFPRAGWLEMGGLIMTGVDADQRGFEPADIVLFEKWKASGRRVVRAPGSWTYHLQGYSYEPEQVAEKRN